jgi:hypothetical protein
VRDATTADADAEANLGVRTRTWQATYTHASSRDSSSTGIPGGGSLCAGGQPADAHVLELAGWYEDGGVKDEECLGTLVCEVRYRIALEGSG